ncbi:MAG: diguanylate cyclase, partial [Thermodesulfobacteriota bacterium]|nr:diguanylate cyclase [Thermodesulfobacteriota bacterium]
ECRTAEGERPLIFRLLFRSIFDIPRSLRLPVRYSTFSFKTRPKGDKFNCSGKKLNSWKSELNVVIQCTISTGVVKTDKTIRTLDELLHRADELLYKAKGSGRNKTIFRI